MAGAPHAVTAGGEDAARLQGLWEGRDGGSTCREFLEGDVGGHRKAQSWFPGVPALRGWGASPFLEHLPPERCPSHTHSAVGTKDNVGRGNSRTSITSVCLVVAV